MTRPRSPSYPGSLASIPVNHHSRSITREGSSGEISVAAQRGPLTLVPVLEDGKLVFPPTPEEATRKEYMEAAAKEGRGKADGLADYFAQAPYRGKDKNIYRGTPNYGFIAKSQDIDSLRTRESSKDSTLRKLLRALTGGRLGKVPKTPEMSLREPWKSKVQQQKVEHVGGESSSTRQGSLRHADPRDSDPRKSARKSHRKIWKWLWKSS